MNTNGHPSPDSTWQTEWFWQYRCGTCGAVVILTRRRVDYGQWRNDAEDHQCVPRIVWTAVQAVNEDRRAWSQIFEIVRDTEQFPEWLQKQAAA